jgi:hypothetical protein
LGAVGLRCWGLRFYMVNWPLALVNKGQHAIKNIDFSQQKPVAPPP